MNTELIIDLVQLKAASVKLERIAAKVDAIKISCPFERSEGETAESIQKLTQDLNALSAAFAQLVRDVKASVDNTREGFKRADTGLAAAWERNAPGGGGDGK